MGEVIVALFVFGFPVAMLVLAWAAGRAIAQGHEADLERRQQAVAHIRLHDLRSPVDAVSGPQPPSLVNSEVTLGIDHFRSFLGQLKSLLGGQVLSYQVVLDRARREVMLRLMEQAHAMGYNAVANVRIEFADISGMATMRRKAAHVSVLASGTAYYVRRQ